MTKTILTNFAPQRVILGLIGVLVVGFIGYMLWLDRPRTLSLDYKSHAVTPSVKQMQVNGQMHVRDSVTGRNQTGGGGYAHRFTDRIDFVVLWYDFLEERAWTAEFSIHGRELTTFGNKRDHGNVLVIVGPGADVTVTTPNRESLRLAGTGRRDERYAEDGSVLPQYRDPVVLREICARPVPVDDPEIQFMIERSKLERPTHVEHALADRIWYLDSKGRPNERCLRN